MDITILNNYASNMYCQIDHQIRWVIKHDEYLSSAPMFIANIYNRFEVRFSQ